MYRRHRRSGMCRRPKKAAAAAAEEDDLETFLALPTLILFWVVTYAVLNEEEED